MEGWEPVVTAALIGWAVAECLDALKSRDSGEIGWAVTVSLGALSMLIYTLVLLFR